MTRFCCVFVVIFLTTITLLTGPALAQSASPSIDTDVVDTDQTVSVTDNVDDQEIADRISGILEATGWYEKAEVSVTDGIVFLDGVTASLKRQNWAQELASKTDGVVAVVNRIDVTQESEFTLEPAISEMRSLWKKVIAAAPLVLLALLILPLTYFIARLVARFARYLMSSRIESPFLRDIMSRLIALPVIFIGIYIVLQVAGLTKLAVSVLGGAGVIGIVVGFAFRDIAENFLASLLLSMRQPFRRGDLIEISSHQGVVHSMNTRSTVLVSSEGNHIQIPNATVFKSHIINYSASSAQRGSFDLGIGYDASIGEVQALIMDVLTAQEEILDTPEPMVLADSFGASTLNMRVYYWFDGAKISSLKLKSVLIRLVKKALNDADISMPDEAREIIFPEGVPIERLASPELSPPQRTAPKDEPVVCASDADLSNEVEDLNDQMSVNVEGKKDDDLLES